MLQDSAGSGQTESNAAERCGDTPWTGELFRECKGQNAATLPTYSLPAGPPGRRDPTGDSRDEHAEQNRDPDPSSRRAIVRGRRRSCTAAARPTPERSTANRSARAPPSWSAARGIGGVQERDQRPAMQLHLTAWRSDQRHMRLSRRGEAACLQAEPSAGRRLFQRAAPDTVGRTIDCLGE